MAVSLTQYRASVGGFHATAVKLSTRHLHFINIRTILPFIILVTLGYKGLQTLILLFFIINVKETVGVVKGLVKSLNQAHYRPSKKNSYKSQDYDTSISSLSMFIIVVILVKIAESFDVHPHPGPTTNLSIVHNNIRSIQKKVDFVEAELGGFDIITLSETHLHSKFPEQKLIMKEFSKPYRRDRHTDNGIGSGGVLIYARNSIYHKHRPDLEVTDLEATWIETRLNQEPFLIGCFYRPPNARVSYWDLIDESIKKAGNTPFKYVVLGDFNFDFLAPPSNHLQRIMNLNSLQQIITQPTRYTDNTATLIDIILTPCPDIIQRSEVLPPVHSDHCCPFIVVKSSSPHKFTFRRTIYNYDKLDVAKYEESLSQTDWNHIILNGNLDDAANNFSEKLLDIARDCMPSKTIKVIERDSPWMTEEIRILIKKKRKLHSNAKRTNVVWRWDLFRITRNKLIDLIRKRKADFIREMDDRINELNNFGDKDWWKLVNRFAKRKGVNDSEIPPLEHEGKTVYSPAEKASIFIDYFMKQSQINGMTDYVPQTRILDTEIQPLFITKEVVKKIIENLNSSKASGPDGIHNKLLMKAISIISEPLSLLFNRSLEEGIFPKVWKRANITPIYKKGNKELCSNYRPVSLLSCIGKVMERCIQCHVFEYLKTNNILTISQSGFIPCDSTTFQLLVIYDDFCKALDKQLTTQAIFFDISKAFDRVWHLGLIRKLHAVGIRGTLLNWFKNYLTDRFQKVVIKGESSDYQLVQAGVPQGSVLGPLLFLIYINDLPDNLESVVKLFADDTSTYLSLEDVDQRSFILNSDLTKITEWAKKWKVDFNPTKTELMTLSTKTLPRTLPIKFDNTTLTETNKHKHLGVILQNDCKWNFHIQSIISKVRLHIACFKSLKYRLSRKALEIIYKTCILPHFDYADVLWDNCTLALSEELEQLNLDAIRTVIGAVRGTSHQKLYDESGMTPLVERRRRHKLTLDYKIINGYAPGYLNEYIPPLITEINPYHRRNLLDRYLPRCRTELYKQSFFPSVTAAWNAIPDEAKRLKSILQFKKYLSSNDQTVPLFFYSHNRISEIIHCRLRLEISDLNADLFQRHLKEDKSCECGYREENAKHYLIDCPRHVYARTLSLHLLTNYDELQIHCLLHGDNRLSIAENRAIFDRVHEFIELSNRFSLLYKK